MPQGLSHHHRKTEADFHKPDSSVDEGRVREQRRHTINRIKSQLSSFFHQISGIPFFLIILALGGMPIAYMGGLSWWLPVNLLIMTLAYSCWALSGWWRGGDTAKMRLSPWMLLFLLPFIIGIFQTIQSGWIVRVFSPAAFQVWGAIDKLCLTDIISRTLSLAPSSTGQNVLFSFVAFLFFFLLNSKAHHRYHLKIVCVAIALAAAGNALLSFVIFFHGPAQGAAQWTSFTGTFLNRNHFGFLMMMGIFACAAMIASIVSQHKKSENDEDWHYWHKFLVPFSILFFFLFVALVLSLSRGAFICTVIPLIIYEFLWLCKRHESSSALRKKLIIMVLLVSSALAFALPYAMQMLLERYHTFFNSDITMDTRFLIWKDTLSLIRDYWLTGVGLGAYGATIQGYAGIYSAEHLVEHAHNDYLELASEIGAPMAILLFTLLITLWCLYFHRVWHQKDRTYRWIGLAGLFAIMGGCMHEIVEFNLHAWSNGIIFTAFLVIVAICGRNRQVAPPVTDSMTNSEKREYYRKDRFKWRLILLAAGIFVLFTLPWQIRNIRTCFQAENIESAMQKDNLYMKPGVNTLLSQKKTMEKILEIFPDNPKYLVKLATLNYNLFKQVDTENNYGNEACQTIAKALQLVPRDGEIALATAKIYEQANLNHLRNDSDEQIIMLYDWAMQCHPTFSATLDEVSTAAYRYFCKAHYLDREMEDARRMYALTCLSSFLESKPNPSEDFFMMLHSVTSDISEVIRRAPENLRSRWTLLGYMIRNGYFRESLELMKQIRTQIPEKSEANDPINKFAWYVRYLALLELEDKGQERADEWPGMIQASMGKQREKLKLAETFLEENHAFSADKVLRTFWKQYPLLPESIIFQARLQVFLGERQQSIPALMPLAFTGVPVSDEVLKSALKILGEASKDWKPLIRIRAKFLKHALNIKLAEQTKDYNGVAQAIKELEEMDNTAETQNSRWFQMHLVPYYAGRGYLLKGNTDKASIAFRRSLQLCPNHLPSLISLSKIGLEKLTPEEKALFELLYQRLSPIAQLAPPVQIMDVRISPRIINGRYQEQQLDYYFLCTGESSDPYKVEVTFSTKENTVFQDIIDFQVEGKPVQVWHAGEVIHISHKLVPSLEVTKHIGILSENGQIYAEFRAIRAKEALSSIPIAKVKAFQFQIKE